MNGKKIFLIAVPLLALGLGAKMTVLKSDALPTCPVSAAAQSPLPTTTMVGDAAGTPQPQEAPTSTATCTPPEPGAALILDSITLNLADGRYLKLGLALQLSATADPKAMQEAGAGARALDAAIELFGAERYDDLISVDQRQAIKAKLSDTITKSYKGEVLGVYFTEFVMQ